MWWLSAARFPGTNVDLELAMFLIFAVPPAAYLLFVAHRMLQAPFRMRHGLCPSCGYDLRATPDRCPECGRVPEPAKLEGVKA